MLHRTVRRLASIVGLVLLAACTSGTGGTESEAGIEFFTAEPSSLVEGESVQLSWKATGASVCYLSSVSAQHEMPTFEVSCTGGWQDSPSVDTNYRFDALIGGAYESELITVRVEEPEIPYDDTAGASEWTAATLADAPTAYTTSLAPGASVQLQVDLPTSTREAVYYELDQALELTVLDSEGAAVASSTTSDYFVRGAPGVTGLVVSGLAPKDVTAWLACRGSCVIEPLPSEERYLRIVNTGTAEATVNLVVVLRDFEDTSEGDAPPTVGEGPVEGALETLGDRDRYVAGVTGTVELVGGALASGLEYRARVYSNGELVDTLLAGDEPAMILAGEEVVVDAVNGEERAGPAGASLYFLDVREQP